jgi:hypothetical protein
LAVAVILLRLGGVQVYQEPWAIDPWFYTALTTNFDGVYGWLNGTYYASRLPMIIPGLLLNSFLTPTQAYVVLHLAFFLAGGAFLYLLVRSLFGVRTALFVFPGLLLNAAYVDSHTSDYFDGYVITYLAGSLYFLVSSIGAALLLLLHLPQSRDARDRRRIPKPHRGAQTTTCRPAVCRTDMRERTDGDEAVWVPSP